MCVLLGVDHHRDSHQHITGCERYVYMQTFKTMCTLFRHTYIYKYMTLYNLYEVSNLCLSILRVHAQQRVKQLVCCQRKSHQILRSGHLSDTTNWVKLSKALCFKFLKPTSDTKFYIGHAYQPHALMLSAHVHNLAEYVGKVINKCTQ